MTRLRQKYKKLKQAFERRPINVVRQASCHPIRVTYRHYLSEQDAVALHNDLDLENLIQERAAKEIAERIIKGKLLTVLREDVFGGTKYYFEVMIVPPLEMSLERWIAENRAKELEIEVGNLRERIMDICLQKTEGEQV